jgi:hypothetical protein
MFWQRGGLACRPDLVCAFGKFGCRHKEARDQFPVVMLHGGPAQYRT